MLYSEKEKEQLVSWDILCNNRSWKECICSVKIFRSENNRLSMFKRKGVDNSVIEVKPLALKNFILGNEEKLKKTNTGCNFHEITE